MVVASFCSKITKKKASYPPLHDLFQTVIQILAHFLTAPPPPLYHPTHKIPSDSIVNDEVGKMVLFERQSPDPAFRT